MAERLVLAVSASHTKALPGRTVDPAWCSRTYYRNLKTHVAEFVACRTQMKNITLILQDASYTQPVELSVRAAGNLLAKSKKISMQKETHTAPLKERCTSVYI